MLRAIIGCTLSFALLVAIDEVFDLVHMGVVERMPLLILIVLPVTLLTLPVLDERYGRRRSRRRTPTP